ncbi:ATP-dependent helicase HrpB [Seongchinamella sediminis]|uniref:ATP-dependent helicase HrpB n=1 Tax=Seongchinamella sediminis TaxID=2283635 RepID=A0A3L7E3Q0_9GAMM|nr:ATP-dependent helicase HrpB [Seongchinamella sediminis]RLQ23031.1 ATP-dependent helicase HrpB [Seongchinamella sediminis]
MTISESHELPVLETLPELRAALAAQGQAVLQAPPGAGKTTAVPLALLREPWLEGRRIVMLEPRRMAARASAARMAELLGEAVGETVGYSIRLESRTSDRTRIEVITEGILTRRLQNDPGLEDVGLVIFDEFHERSLDSDLCLALCLQGRQLFRESSPLRLLVMSATLDGEAVARLLDNAPIITSTGRQFPVATHFGATHRLQDPIGPAAAAAVRRALREQSGSVLVFLPGQREINATGRELAKHLATGDVEDVVLTPLHGSLSLEKQQRAIAPAPAGQRKVVLATNVAETSLTIEGITAVVDTGLVREALFDPATGMTRLTTRRISRASAEQRQGRAGRLGPGHCYRLWSAEQHGRLVAQSSPEILQADLAPLALQLLAWGVSDPGELAWLDAPPAVPWQQALDILERCGALFYNQTQTVQLTPHGVRLAQMPLHPRLAHMLLVGCDIHATETACLVAAVLSERNPLAGTGADLAGTLAVLLGEQRCPQEAQGWFRRIWQQARRFARIASDIHKPRRFAIAVDSADVLGVLLASAYPDRIARRRDSGEGYQLGNGRSAHLPAEDALAREPWLAVADIGSQAGQSTDRIFSAVRLNPQRFSDILSPLVREEDMVDWDNRLERFVAQRRTLCGQLQVAVEPLSEVPEESRSQALLGVVRRRGLAILPWTRSLQQWRDRVRLLHEACSSDPQNPWPDLAEAALLDSMEQWLLPYLGPVNRLEDFQKLDLKAILHALLPWPLPLELERLAPERISVPSGSSVAVDYSQRPPVLAVKLQEMFGCEDTPTIAGGRVALQVHLLSPAQRPLQVTQDLAGFWRSSYQDVKKEMKGRYPKHPWPDDPLQAVATRHTKKRLEQA